jgi:hypothetical protein
MRATLYLRYPSEGHIIYAERAIHILTLNPSSGGLEQLVTNLRS